MITKLDDPLLNERLDASLSRRDDILIRITRDSLRAALAQIAIADRLAEAAFRKMDCIFTVSGETFDLATEYLEGRGK